MKKVRIVRGTYGYQPKDDGRKKVRRTVPVMRGQAIEVSDAEAKRLVEMGVAEYVAKEAEPEPKENGKGGTENGKGGTEDGKAGIGEISLPPVPGLNHDGGVQ